MKRIHPWFVAVALVPVACAASPDSSTTDPGHGVADSGKDAGQDGASLNDSGGVPEASHMDAPPLGDMCGDGYDNNGDGQIDEGCSCKPGDTQECYTGKKINAGVGACVKGVQTCQPGNGTYGSWGACEGAVLPSEEKCDGIDNNCDGTKDEGCPCVDGTEQPCTNICGTGTQKCVGGALETCSAPTPQPETCNNKDDDCDGQTDEQLTESCSSSCGTGEKVCSKGQWGDCSAPSPIAETCNDLDDDCDGQTDEGDVCPGCPAQTVSWDGCQGTVDPTAHGQQRQVKNATAGKAGDATFNCSKGTWTKVSGKCGTSLCTYDWGTQVASSGAFVKVYVALLNRSPDPSGLYYWNQGGDTDQNIYTFSTSQEAMTEFQSFNSPDFIVTHIYHTAFNRAPQPAGHDYWVGQFNNGTYHTNDSTLGSFVNAIFDGAASEDAAALQHRVDVASYWTRQLIDHRCPWDDFGKTVLNNVDTNTNVAIPKSAIDQKISQMEQTIKQ